MMEQDFGDELNRQPRRPYCSTIKFVVVFSSVICLFRRNYSISSILVAYERRLAANVTPPEPQLLLYVFYDTSKYVKKAYVQPVFF